MDGIKFFDPLITRKSKNKPPTVENCHADRRRRSSASQKNKTPQARGCFFVVVPVGERSYYEVDDFHKILEFTGLLEPLTD